MLQRREKEEEERGIEFMSFNQSRAERSESLSRRHGRSGIYSQQQRSFAGGGGAAPPTSPALSTNKRLFFSSSLVFVLVELALGRVVFANSLFKNWILEIYDFSLKCWCVCVFFFDSRIGSFKKSGTGQGGQSRMGPTTTLSSESNVVVATTRATPNGVRVQSQLHGREFMLFVLIFFYLRGVFFFPLNFDFAVLVCLKLRLDCYDNRKMVNCDYFQCASDVPVLGAGKPIDSYVPKSSRALPKAPSSQSESASAAADSSTPGTPSKGSVLFLK